MSMSVLINIDVPDLEAATDFYTAAFGLHVGRRFGTDAIVFADDGQLLENVSQDQAKTIGAQFLRMPSDKLHYERTLTEVDQWTLGQSRHIQRRISGKMAPPWSSEWAPSPNSYFMS